jgi:hypothetical protein
MELGLAALVAVQPKARGAHASGLEKYPLKCNAEVSTIGPDSGMMDRPRARHTMVILHTLPSWGPPRREHAARLVLEAHVGYNGGATYGDPYHSAGL